MLLCYDLGGVCSGLSGGMPCTLLIDLLPEDKEFITVEQELQSTIREHRDNGQSGGIFNRYNIVRVSLKIFMISQLKHLFFQFVKLFCCNQNNILDTKNSKP